MKPLTVFVCTIFFLAGCATHFYVPPAGDAVGYKSLQECHLAHPDDGAVRCVDRSQYTAATQNTVLLVLNGLVVALLAILTFGHLK